MLGTNGTITTAGDTTTTLLRLEKERKMKDNDIMKDNVTIATKEIMN
jgi:hypothetical protein